VIGGQLSMRLPTGCSGVAHYRSAARRSPWRGVAQEGTALLV